MSRVDESRPPAFGDLTLRPGWIDSGSPESGSATTSSDLVGLACRSAERCCESLKASIVHVSSETSRPLVSPPSRDLGPAAREGAALSRLRSDKQGFHERRASGRAARVVRPAWQIGDRTRASERAGRRLPSAPLRSRRFTAEARIRRFARPRTTAAGSPRNRRRRTTRTRCSRLCRCRRRPGPKRRRGPWLARQAAPSSLR